MAAALTPRVRMMAICDGVRESKLEAGTFNLKSVRDKLTTRGFPFIPSQLWLFLVLSSHRPGQFPGHVAVINDRTDKSMFFTHMDPGPTFDAGNAIWSDRASIRCTFP